MWLRKYKQSMGIESKEIGKIRKAIKDSRGTTAESIRRGGERNWDIYDSPFEDFADEFFNCLPGNEEKWRGSSKEEKEKSATQFRSYIEETLSNGHEEIEDKKPVEEFFAVEFGGPGSALFKGFTKNFFRRTAGICLKDIRDMSQQTQDKINNHSVIEENMLPVNNAHDKQFLLKVLNELGAKKVNLIVSSVKGAAQLINKHPAILDRLIRNWYEILSENGLIFLNFGPTAANDLVTQKAVEQWVTAVVSKYPLIDIQLKLKHERLRLHKRKGAPEKLPPARQLFVDPA